MSSIHQKRYEEFAFILDYRPNSRSSLIKGRDGTIIQGIGLNHLTLLEILGSTDKSFTIGEKIGIGKDGRSKVISVLGKLLYSNLTSDSVHSLSEILETIVSTDETFYVNFFNDSQALTPRLHSLEVIPGIGKTLLSQILKERDIDRFSSFSDLQERIHIRNPSKLVARRLFDELSGHTKLNIFVRT